MALGHDPFHCDAHGMECGLALGSQANHRDRKEIVTLPVLLAHRASTRSPRCGSSVKPTSS